MTMNKLNVKQSFELAILVKDEFVNSNLNDKEFAEFAANKLGFHVNSDHVKTRRNFLEIKPKNVRVYSKHTLESLFELLCEAFDRLDALERANAKR